MTKKAKYIIPGDRVFAQDGRKLAVVKISNVYMNEVRLEYDIQGPNNYSCIRHDDYIDYEPAPKEAVNLQP